RPTAQQFGVNQIEHDLAKVAGAAHAPAFEHDRRHRAKLVGGVFFDTHQEFAATDMAIFAGQVIATEVRHRVVECIEYKVVRMPREPTVPAAHGLNLVFEKVLISYGHRHGSSSGEAVVLHHHDRPFENRP